jgi:rhodanese-related sulfurtransferase
MSYSVIAPADLIAICAKGTAVTLIDVRTPKEYAAVHAVGARNVPLDTLDPAALIAGRTDGHPLYILCHSGARARTAADKLVTAGCTQVVVVDGGTKGWQAANGPVVTGTGCISVERQTQMTIGIGVLTGALLAWFVHPAFVWLAAFFGAGLTMAGITGLCPLALVIAAMPWNRSSTPTAGASCCSAKS